MWRPVSKAGRLFLERAGGFLAIDSLSTPFYINKTIPDTNLRTAQGIAGLILMQPQVPTSSVFSTRTVLRSGDLGLLRALPLRSILLNSLILLLTGLILL